jgi:formylglycine-generating enzyme required for sulfatase activity
MVDLKRPYYIGRFQVTNREFREFKADHLSGIFKDETLDLERQPATRVSWQEAAAFCNWLSARDKLPPAYARRGDRLELIAPVTTGYRLPTEAEWGSRRASTAAARRANTWQRLARPRAPVIRAMRPRSLTPVTISGYDGA